MSENIRCFVAVQLSDDLCEAIWMLQKQLQKHSPMRGLRWIDPGDLHITIKFIIGGVPAIQLPRIVTALDNIAEKRDPFTIKLKNLGTFPNIHRPSLLWLGLDEGEKELQTLFKAIENKLGRLGLKAERRAYHAHLTLARVPKNWSQSQRRALGQLIGPTKVPDLPTSEVEGIALIRSILTPEGPDYMRLSHSIFAQAPPI